MGEDVQNSSLSTRHFAYVGSLLSVVLLTITNLYSKLITVTVSLTMEAIGYITASAELSRVDVDGPEFDTRLQGGVLVRFDMTTFHIYTPQLTNPIPSPTA